MTSGTIKLRLDNKDIELIASVFQDLPSIVKEPAIVTYFYVQTSTMQGRPWKILQIQCVYTYKDQNHAFKNFFVPLYESKGWILKKQHIRNISTFEFWFWRRFLRILWIDKKTNKWIVQQINPEYWETWKERIEGAKWINLITLVLDALLENLNLKSNSGQIILEKVYLYGY